MQEKPVLVLIHGHGVDATLWDGIYAELFTEHRVIRPDFAQRTTHESIEAYAEELFSILDTGAIRRCILIGHSMGGYIALAFAEHHPEMVSGLVLFHSSVFADDEDRKAKRRQAIEKLETEGTRVFVEETVPKMFAEQNQQRLANVIRQRVEQSAQLPAEALIAGIRAIAGRSDRSHVLKDARFSVLLIIGQQDNMVSFDVSQRMQAIVPNAQCVIFEDAGHMGMLEKPEESLRAIRQFVTDSAG